MLKQFSKEELLGKPPSESQRAEILAGLQAAGDEGIDFSDIPEIREIPPGAVRGLSNVSRAVPVYLDRELQIRLSAIAVRKGVSLSDLVSQLLRKEIEIAEVLA
jgi:predicted HicB family RNase H-like nuclease